MNQSDILLDENLDGKPLSIHDVTMASAGQRFVNNFIDGIAIWFLMVAYMMFLMLALGVFNNPAVADKIMEGPYIPLLMLMYFVPPVYYTLMEHFAGRTLGKFASGTKVVDRFGNKPSFMTCVVRTLIRIVPFEFVSAFSSSGRMWHDKWTHTFLIRTR